MTITEAPKLTAEGESATAGNAGEFTNVLKEVAVQNLTPQIARQLNLPKDTAGVVIVDIQPDSAAESAGLQRGDVIQELNRRPVMNTDGYNRIVSRIDANGTALLLVNRGGSTLYIALSPEGQ